MDFKKLKKRYFNTLKDFLNEGRKMNVLQKKIQNIKAEDKISPAFAEKIMLAVTGVNGCVYCSYFHAKTALEKGVNDKEIQSIFKGEFNNIQENELTTLLYAQHWTDNAGNPSNDTRNKMIEYYCAKKKRIY